MNLHRHTLQATFVVAMTTLVGCGGGAGLDFVPPPAESGSLVLEMPGVTDLVRKDNALTFKLTCAKTRTGLKGLTPVATVDDDKTREQVKFSAASVVEKDWCVVEIAAKDVNTVKTRYKFRGREGVFYLSGAAQVDATRKLAVTIYELFDDAVGDKGFELNVAMTLPTDAKLADLKKGDVNLVCQGLAGRPADVLASGKATFRMPKEKFKTAVSCRVEAKIGTVEYASTAALSIISTTTEYTSALGLKSEVDGLDVKVSAGGDCRLNAAAYECEASTVTSQAAG